MSKLAGPSYRAFETALALQRATAELHTRLEPAIPGLRKVYVRRIGRITTGVALLAVGVATFGATIGFKIGETDSLTWYPGDGSLTWILLSAWPMAFLACVLGRVLGGKAAERLAQRRFDAGSDPIASLDCV